MTTTTVKLDCYICGEPLTSPEQEYDDTREKPRWYIPVCRAHLDEGSRDELDTAVQS